MCIRDRCTISPRPAVDGWLILLRNDGKVNVLLTDEDDHLVRFSESHVDKWMTDVKKAVDGDGAQGQ